MTEKPNSVCKGCQQKLVFNTGFYISVSSGSEYCPSDGSRLGRKHEPVAEPAEPSASPRFGNECQEHWPENNPDCDKCQKFWAPVSAEPTAERPKECQRCHYTECPHGKCPMCDWPCKICKAAAPQPVAACTGITACTQKEACLKVNRCLINLPQPVAGEGPQCHSSPNEKHRFAMASTLERCVWCGDERDLGRESAYEPREGTPKLEEAVDAIMQLGYTHDRAWQRDAFRKALRPFITPACSPPEVGICPECNAKNQLTLGAFNGRIGLVCGACHQWWSIGEIEHTPYFFGYSAASNGPNMLRRCEVADCNYPVWYGVKCDEHTTSASTTDAPRPGRTKLMMKFWSAMHLAGFAKDKEWDAQEKIHIQDLVKLLEENGLEHNCPDCGRWHSILKPPATPASTGEPPAPTSVPQAEPPKESE